jgi:hypothetical protein
VPIGNQFTADIIITNVRPQNISTCVFSFIAFIIVLIVIILIITHWEKTMESPTVPPFSPYHPDNNPPYHNI